jgi:hypothetical protein
MEKLGWLLLLPVKRRVVGIIPRFARIAEEEGFKKDCCCL